MTAARANARSRSRMAGQCVKATVQYRNYATKWLCGFLELLNGIPSHDDLSNVIGRIDNEAFPRTFAAWVLARLQDLAAHEVKVDSKNLRGKRGADGTVIIRIALTIRNHWAIKNL